MNPVKKELITFNSVVRQPSPIFIDVFR